MHKNIARLIQESFHSKGLSGVAKRIKVNNAHRGVRQQPANHRATNKTATPRYQQSLHKGAIQPTPQKGYGIFGVWGSRVMAE